MQKISFCERYMLTTAVLKRFKTNTRRLEKALERLIANYEKQYGEPFRLVEQKWDGTKNRLVLYAHTGIADTDREHVLTLNTRYKVGEVVAVAQSYSTILKELEDPRNFECMEQWEASSAIRALYAEFLQMKDCPGWSNKMFVRPDLLPHQIQITGIRIERLQAISNDDCLKEGVTYDSRHWVNGYKVAGLWNKYLQQSHWRSPREAFAALINSPGVGRKGLWGSNPFVVVYDFQLAK